jgi:hypothetical protein
MYKTKYHASGRENVESHVTGVLFGVQGFTLVETVVAILLLMIAIVGPIGLAQRSLTSAFQAQNKITATYLAQDAIEFIKNARDTNIIEGRERLEGLYNLCGASCRIDTVSALGVPEDAACPISICSGDITFNSSTNQYGHQTGAEWESTNFFRSVQIVARTGAEATATATVSWDTTFGTESITVSQGLFNPAGSSAFDPNEGLVVHYDFEEGSMPVFDKSGNGNTGTSNGDDPPTWTTQGISGSAVIFDPPGGTRDRIWIKEDPIINMSSALTLSFWVRGLDADQPDDVWLLLTHKYSGVAGQGWMVNYRPRNSGGPNLEMRIVTDAGSQTALGEIPTVAIPPEDGALDGFWHHVVWTVNNGSVVSYLDGKSTDFSTYPAGNGFSNNIDICLADNCEAPFEFDGSMDEFRLYNRALSPAEVLQLYQYSPPASGLVGHWDFDESSGTTVFDRSGFGYDGTIVGGASRVAGLLTGSSAISLDGSTQYVSFDAPLPAGQGSQLYTESVTVAALVNFEGSFPSPPPPPARAIVNFDTPGTSGGGNENHRQTQMDVRFTGCGPGNVKSRLRYVYFNSSNDTGRKIDSCDINDLGPIGWHYFVASYDKDNLTSSMYLDGQLFERQEGVAIGVVDMLPGWFAIGARATSVNDWWDGLIDDVRIYNRALSDPEQCSLYKQVTGDLVC